MTDYRKKTVRMTRAAIDRLPENKPVLYRVLDRDGENLYTGVAGRGNVRERIEDHMIRGRDPVPSGAKVRIEQKLTIQEARRVERNVIARSKPRYNRRGK